MQTIFVQSIILIKNLGREGDHQNNIISISIQTCIKWNIIFTERHRIQRKAQYTNMQINDITLICIQSTNRVNQLIYPIRKCQTYSEVIQKSEQQQYIYRIMKLPLLPLISEIIIEYVQLPTSEKTFLLGRKNILPSMN